MKVNKAWIYIILICLAFLIHGEYYKTYFSLFVGFVWGLCGTSLHIMRGHYPNIKKSKNKKMITKSISLTNVTDKFG